MNLTPDFYWVGDPALRFFYDRGEKTRGAQLRMFCEEQEYFVTKSGVWQLAGQRFPLEQYLEALRYLPQAEIRRLSPEADQYIVLVAADDAPADAARTITYTARGAGPRRGAVSSSENRAPARGRRRLSRRGRRSDRSFLRCVMFYHGSAGGFCRRAARFYRLRRDDKNPFVLPLTFPGASFRLKIDCLGFPGMGKRL